MIGTPVILSSPITLLAVLGDTKSPSDPTALQCPDKASMLVEELRIHRTTMTDAVEYDLAVGRAKITNGFLPPELFCRHDNLPQTNFTSCWRFPRPLFIPAGRAISIIARNQAAAARSLQVSLRAWILPKGYPEPRTVSVPYATAFYPAAGLAAGTSNAVMKSVTGDLTNPFAVPFNVRYFLGWAPTRDVYFTAFSSRNMQRISGRYTAKMQVFDWNGNPLVRNQTYLQNLCSSSGTNAWEQPFTLPPQRSLYAVMSEDNTGNTQTPPPRTGISLVGWRNVPLSEVK